MEVSLVLGTVFCQLSKLVLLAQAVRQLVEVHYGGMQAVEERRKSARQGVESEGSVVLRSNAP